VHTNCEERKEREREKRRCGGTSRGAALAVLVLVVNITPVVRANQHHIRKKVKKAVRNISQLLFTCKEKIEGTEDCFISCLD
jgi:hypothetical protein